MVLVALCAILFCQCASMPICPMFFVCQAREEYLTTVEMFGDYGAQEAVADLQSNSDIGVAAKVRKLECHACRTMMKTGGTTDNFSSMLIKLMTAFTNETKASFGKACNAKDHVFAPLWLLMDDATKTISSEEVASAFKPAFCDTAPRHRRQRGGRKGGQGEGEGQYGE